MNIPAILKVDCDEEAVVNETPQHQMVVRLRGSAIIIEDADQVLVDEKGRTIRSIPSFRVMLDATEAGVKVYLWKQGSDVNSWPPDFNTLLAGWFKRIDPRK